MESPRMPLRVLKIIGNRAMSARNIAPINVILERIFAIKSGSRLAGTDTRDGAVILTKIIGHFHRIILNRHIEISKQDNQENKAWSTSSPGGEGIQNALPEAGGG